MGLEIPAVESDVDLAKQLIDTGAEILACDDREEMISLVRTAREIVSDLERIFPEATE